MYEKKISLTVMSALTKSFWISNTAFELVFIYFRFGYKDYNILLLFWNFFGQIILGCWSKQMIKSLPFGLGLEAFSPKRDQSFGPQLFGLQLIDQQLRSK